MSCSCDLNVYCYGISVIVSLFISAANEVSNLLGTDRGRVETAMNNSLMFLVHQPPLRQFGVGVGAGWVSGYVFIQVSRLAAILGGCTALALWVSMSFKCDHMVDPRMFQRKFFWQQFN